MDEIYEFGSWAQGSKCYEWLSFMDEMNDFGLRVEGFKC